MATPKKLPSGRWRVRVFDYTDPNGRKHYKSITADTKKECTLLAAQFDNNKARIQRGDLTVLEAVDKYIDAKSQVLSKSTIRGYDSMKKNYFDDIGRYKIHLLTNNDVQRWINTLSQKLSPKTVKNIYGLLAASIDMYAPEIIIRITLPAPKKTELYVPSDQDVKLLIDSTDDIFLKRALLLAAFGPLRRGEICALTASDIFDNVITVNKSMVKDKYGEWSVKQPKTIGSYRHIVFPEFVTTQLLYPISPECDRIVNITPDVLTMRFERALNKSGLPHFRFHDLRHYSASIMHAIGIPDQYIMQRGGWVTDGVMKSVYRGTIDEQTEKMTAKINDHFASL